MTGHIQFNESPRSRRLRIVIYPSGEVVVKMPVGFSRQKAEAFVEEKKEWIEATIVKFQKYHEKHKNALALPKANGTDFKKYQGLALILVKERLEFFNRKCYEGRFAWQRVTIRNQKSRWGSCSKRGNLNFNYRIVMLPAALADYLVVHELCHLGEMNHSKKFWDLVAIAIPECKKLSKELRRVRNV